MRDELEEMELEEIEEFRDEQAARSAIVNYRKRKYIYESKLLALSLSGLGDSRDVASYGGIGGGGGMREVQTSEVLVKKYYTLERSHNSKCVHAVRQAKTLLIEKYGEKRADILFEIMQENLRDPSHQTFGKLKDCIDFKLCRTDYFEIRKRFIGFVAEYIENS